MAEPGYLRRFGRLCQRACTRARKRERRIDRSFKRRVELIARDCRMHPAAARRWLRGASGDVDSPF